MAGNSCRFRRDTRLKRPMSSSTLVGIRKFGSPPHTSPGVPWPRDPGAKKYRLGQALADGMFLPGPQARSASTCYASDRVLGLVGGLLGTALRFPCATLTFHLWIGGYVPDRFLSPPAQFIRLPAAGSLFLRHASSLVASSGPTYPDDPLGTPFQMLESAAFRLEADA
jgi:hypothetical protein